MPRGAPTGFAAQRPYRRYGIDSFSIKQRRDGGESVGGSIFVSGDIAWHQSNSTYYWVIDHIANLTDNPSLRQAMTSDEHSRGITDLDTLTVEQRCSFACAMPELARAAEDTSDLLSAVLELVSLVETAASEGQWCGHDG